MCNSGSGRVYSSAEAGGPLNHADLPPTSSGKNYMQQQLFHLHRTRAPFTINMCHVCVLRSDSMFRVSQATFFVLIQTQKHFGDAAENLKCCE